MRRKGLIAVRFDPGLTWVSSGSDLGLTQVWPTANQVWTWVWPMACALAFLQFLGIACCVHRCELAVLTDVYVSRCTSSQHVRWLSCEPVSADCWLTQSAKMILWLHVKFKLGPNAKSTVLE